MGLRGKPAPDTFLEGAKRLRVEPSRTAVLEDAIAGVRAGRAGAFGVVIGVDRVADPEALERAGAHVVVSALDHIQLIGRSVRAVALR
jgi:beta-phosphoglucomutase-like phosphatase (HAD superfamily)